MFCWSLEAKPALAGLSLQGVVCQGDGRWQVAALQHRLLSPPWGAGTHLHHCWQVKDLAGNTWEEKEDPSPNTHETQRTLITLYVCVVIPLESAALRPTADVWALCSIVKGPCRQTPWMELIIRCPTRLCNLYSFLGLKITICGCGLGTITWLFINAELLGMWALYQKSWETFEKLNGGPPLSTSSACDVFQFCKQHTRGNLLSFLTDTLIIVCSFSQDLVFLCFFVLSFRFWHRCSLHQWQRRASRPGPPQGVRPREKSGEEPGQLQRPPISCIQYS